MENDVRNPRDSSPSLLIPGVWSPLNLGLVRRALRETFAMTLAMGFALGGFAALLNYALPRFQARMMGGGRGKAPPMLENVRSAVLGMETGGLTNTEIATSIAWAHPVVMALLWAHAIVFCTRVPAAEVERGTIDVLLGLPVSRWQVYVSETAAWLLSGAFLIGCAAAGSLVGGSYLDASLRPEFSRVAVILLNLFAMYAAVGGIGLLTCSLSDRRGRAVLVVLFFVVGSFLMNYLKLFWPEMAWTAKWSLLEYYRPGRVLSMTGWPVRDLEILGGAFVALWIAGGVVMARRDLSTT